MTDLLRRIVLARRPQGRLADEDFRLETAPLPAPGAGEVLVRTVWLSLDPYMRGRLNDAPSYTAPVGLGQPIHGESVGEVVAGTADGLRPGDLVIGHGGWQSHWLGTAATARRLEPAGVPLAAFLGPLGMPGHTAYAAIDGVIRPKPGETVVVPAATGAVGSVAAQLARARGARVIGIAGGAGKCAYAERELGCERCLDRHEPDLAGRLRAACPDGVDGYVELVGGEVFWAVLPLLAIAARVPVIGGIAAYNAASPPPGPDRTPQLLRTILVRRLVVQGLLVWDWRHLEDAFRAEVGGMIRAGRLHWKEDVADGLEQAPAALMAMLEGGNFGKQLVRVGPDPAGGTP